MKEEYTKAKALKEAHEANVTKLETEKAALKTLKEKYDSKKTEIEGIQKTITEAIEKRENAKAYAGFDKGDGNNVQRHLFNSQFKTTDKAKTRASIITKKLIE